MRIVQPNVAQAEKWRPENRARQLAELVELSRRPGFDRLAAVVWPETAPSFIVEPGSPALAIMARAVPPGGYLLAGAARGTGRRDDGVWNSLLVIDGTGAIVAHYDKVHLVPLGEYIPFHKQLAPVSGFIGRGSFEVGEAAGHHRPSGPAVLLAGHLLRGDLSGRRHRSWRAAAWLLNVTNDAWFGLSSGPYQHLVSARLRAVEEGLPMIRAANTGVSAVIDAYGRVLASLDMEQQGIIDHRTSAGARGHALQPLGRLDAAGVDWISRAALFVGGRQKVGSRCVILRFKP